jgi:hypothetical protein
MEPEVRARLTPQIVFGFVVLTVGVLFTLDNLGVIDSSTYLAYWPVALILIGFTKALEGRGGAGFIAAMLWVSAGAWLLLHNLGLLRVSVWEFWPLLLVVLGASLVWRGLSGRSGSSAAGDSESALSGLAIMSGVVRRSNAQEFRRGDLTAVMGGCEVDLRGASIKDEAVIDVFAFWGGIEIRVPEDWTVTGRVVPFMGAFEDKTRPPKESSKRLVVKGFVVMGGVEVKN